MGSEQVKLTVFAFSNLHVPLDHVHDIEIGIQTQKPLVHKRARQVFP